MKSSSYQIISTRTHGILDFATAGLLIAAPYLLGFANGTIAQYLPMALGGMLIAQSLLTKYEFGVLKVIPMPVHLALDAMSAILLAASPWLFGFAGVVYLPHLAVGLMELVVGALTKMNPPRAAMA